MKKIKVPVIAMAVLFSFSHVFTFTTLTSCKKYDEGPMVSFASKRGRVVNTWNIGDLYKNGQKQSLTDHDKSVSVKFERDGKMVITTSNGSSASLCNGTWDFDIEKNHLITTIHYSFGTEIKHYKIVRLRSNELWLLDEEGHDRIEIHYIPE